MQNEEDKKVTPRKEIKEDSDIAITFISLFIIALGRQQEKLLWLYWC